MFGDVVFMRWHQYSQFFELFISEYPSDECSMFGDVVFMRCHQYSKCFDLFFQNILQMSVQCFVMCL